MKQILLTQGIFALVDNEDYAYLNQWRWCANRVGRTFYATRGRRKADGPGPNRIHMHRVILDPADGLETDHINGDGLDNRRVNLRAVTPAINQANHMHRWRNRKRDLPMGVYPHGRRFQALICINGHRHYLDTFDTPQEASAIYQAARDERITKELAALGERVLALQ